MNKLHDYSKIILTATAVSLRVFMDTIVSSSSADECKGCSSLEDGTQTAAGFLLVESTERTPSRLNVPQQAILNNLKISPNATKGGADKAPKNNAVPEQSGSFAEMLVPISGISSSDIILDVSPNATECLGPKAIEYIEVAINIPYTRFVKVGGTTS